MATVAVSPSEYEVPKASLLVAAFSTIVEWYDFTLYLYMTTIISRVFFGGSDTAISSALLTFAVGYLLRPVGAVFFGRIGDRLGRRRMMLLSMALMTVAMLATALLPTYDQIGAAAGWLLLALRALMAFSVGGEYTGVVAYLMEGAKDSRRGFVASLAAAASEVGALLASAAAFVVALLATDDLDTWGWRVPFFIGAALAGSVWIARSFMDESPDFEAQERHGTVPDSPVLETWRHHRPAIVRTFTISALGSITYYVGIGYVPTYLASVGKFEESDALWLATVAGFAVIVITPLAGALSDRIGRRPAMLVFAVGALVLPLTMFGFMDASTRNLALVGAVVLAWVAGGVSAVAASCTPEQFPGEGRLSGLALGVTAATAFFGGLTPLIAEKLTTAVGWAPLPGAMIALVALVAIPVIATMPETAPSKTDLRRSRS